jgi:hypothetical protein
MFDLMFHASVSGYVKYMHYLQQDTLPNGEGHSRVSIRKYFGDMVCSVSILLLTQVTDIFMIQAEDYHLDYMNFYYSYYMKVYFKYFNLNYPSSTNK